jgi:hypothetical protein
LKGLESLGETRILGDGKDAFLFRQLMIGLNANLLRTVALVQDSTGKKLYGFEFMDVITQPGRGSCMKELKLELASKHWIDITNVVDVVIVCADLGDAITAANRAGTQSEHCNRIPRGFDYLAATICCLKRLVERRGGSLDGDVKAQLFQISEKSFWDLAKDPFSACNHKLNSESCWKRPDIFQRLIPRWERRLRMLVNQVPTSTAISIPVSGAVVFGAASATI